MRILFVCVMLPIVFALTGSSVGQQVEQSEKAAEEIKSLIPAATSMTEEEWRSLTSAARVEFENQCLMVQFLTLETDSEDEAKQAEFSYLTETPAPAELARVVAKGKHRTFVKPERITEFTCDIRMELATGVVRFAIPEMYKGQFEYEATELDDGWKITQIRMPAYELLLKINDDGVWEKHEFE